MVDLVGAFGRGFAVGDKVGSRVSEVRARRKAAALERQYLNDEMTEDEYRAALQEAAMGATGRGVTAGGTTTTVTDKKGGAYTQTSGGTDLASHLYTQGTGAMQDRLARQAGALATPYEQREAMARAHARFGKLNEHDADMQRAMRARAYAEGPGDTAAMPGHMHTADANAAARYGDAGTGQLYETASGAREQYAAALTDQLYQAVQDPKADPERVALLLERVTDAAHLAGYGDARLAAAEFRYDPEKKEYVAYLNGKGVMAIDGAELPGHIEKFLKNPKGLLNSVLDARAEDAKATRDASRKREKAILDAEVHVIKSLVDRGIPAGTAKAGGKLASALGNAGFEVVDEFKVTDPETGAVSAPVIAQNGQRALMVVNPSAVADAPRIQYIDEETNQVIPPSKFGVSPADVAAMEASARAVGLQEDFALRTEAVRLALNSLQGLRAGASPRAPGGAPEVGGVATTAGRSPTTGEMRDGVPREELDYALTADGHDPSTDAEWAIYQQTGRLPIERRRGSASAPATPHFGNDLPNAQGIRRAHEDRAAAILRRANYADTGPLALSRMDAPAQARALTGDPERRRALAAQLAEEEEQAAKSALERIVEQHRFKAAGLPAPRNR